MTGGGLHPAVVKNSKRSLRWAVCHYTIFSNKQDKLGYEKKSNEVCWILEINNFIVEYSNNY